MAPRIILPQNWNSGLTGNYVLSIASDLFEMQGAKKPWSFSMPSANTLRFELRDGDQHVWDTTAGHGSERDELASKTTTAYGIPIHVGYEFTLAPGARNTADWMVIGQFHQNLTAGGKPWSPPFEISMRGETMIIDVRYSTGDGTCVTKRVFTDISEIKRGHSYDIDVSVVFDPSGNGRLVVTRDNVTIADYSGPLGYVENTGVYWSQGLYRDGKASETVVATYSNIVLESGNAVKIPGAQEFIAAPELQIGEVSNAAANGTRVVELSGTAKAGTTVSIMENGHVIGKAATDASGHFQLEVTIKGNATHLLSAVATNAAGRDGLTHSPVSIEMVTAAGLVSRLSTLVKDESLGKIVLLDNHLLHVSSRGEISQFLRSSLPGKIDGEVTFVITSGMTGKDYDRQDEFFSSSGVVVERIRYSGSRVTFDETVLSPTHTSVKNFSANGTWTLAENLNGKLVSYQTYSASNKLTSSALYNSDGTKSSVAYDAGTGNKISDTKYGADGSRVESYYGIVGKDYVKQAFVFDKAGKMLSQERYSGNDVKLFDVKWLSNGTVETRSFDAAGHSQTTNIVSADGSRVYTTYSFSDKGYATQVSHYNTTKTLIYRDSFDTLGHITKHETFGTNPSVKTYLYETKNGSLSGWTVTNPDKTYVTYSLHAGTADKVSHVEYFNKSGVLISEKYYDLQGVQVTMPAQSTSVHTYTYDAATGMKTGMTTADADGSYKVTKFVPGSESVVKMELYYAADGRFMVSNSYNAATGKLERTELREADGTIEWHYFNPVTGAETSYNIRYADKSRTDANLAITGKDYTQQIATYDGAGKLVEMVRRHGDENHTLAFSQKVNADGSAEVHNYDIRGRETVRIITETDGSRDATTFTYSNAVTMQSSANTHTHFGANNVKQWVDDTKVDGSHVQSTFVSNVTLTSHEGVMDTFTGMKGGADTFVFNAHFGKDTVVGFEAGSAKHDVLAFDADLIPDYAHLQAMMTKVGNDTLITVSPSDSVLIKSVAPSSFVADDFRFIHHQDGLNV